MKKVFTFLAAILLSIVVFAQSPGKMSYQAVVRDANNDLVTNTQVGMQISILQGSINGNEVYIETQNPTTNENGLVSVEIGGGTIQSGDFSTIDWSNGPYFIKTETDPQGGTNYTITGTNQLLSVPYALHAKTADSLNGTITETDPVYSISEAANITATDIINLGNLSGVNTGDQDISGIATNEQAIQDTASQIRADIPDVSGFLTSENDPIYSSSEAANITATDITNLDNLSGVNTGDQDLSALATKTALGDSTALVRSEIPDVSGIATNAQAIQDTASQIRADIPTNNNQLTNGAGYITSYTETDPSVPSGTEIGEMQYWNGSSWVTIAATGKDSATLQMIGGIPTWVGGITPNVTNPTTGKIWMDRNLGAMQVATGSTDTAAYGDLYQWGRGADGHESRTSNTTSTLSGSDTPGHNNFITVDNSPYDWRSPKNDNLWQGVNGINNPCPSGFRLPTEAEWEAERTSWSSNDTAGAFASPLKLPIAGSRSGNSGSLFDVGVSGYYWSSTVDGDYSRELYIYDNSAGTHQGRRAYGISVRCIKD